MLHRIANKACDEMIATTLSGGSVRFKLLNTTYVGIRKLHTDMQAVANIDSGILAGEILTIQTGEALTVSTITTDYYRSKPIRLALDLVENNNTVTIKRNAPILSPQGGVLGTTETELYTAIPVKIGTVLQTKDRNNDLTLSQFGMLLSSQYPVELGDTLVFGKHYEKAKVEGIKLNYEGIYEITFDKDPRWT